MKFGVIIFPGSNCDHDAYWAISEVAKQPVTFLWHDSPDLQGCDAIIVPGGFAYGDYLRTGAIAKFSPVMESVRKFAADGGLVLGICNGFQILCESGLLPGALLRNAGLKYVCKPVNIRVESTNTPFTQQLTKGEVLEIPIGHMEGNYFCDRADPGRVEGPGPHHIPLHHTGRRGHRRRQSQWLVGEHCRNLQRRSQRSGHDAASGARRCAGAGHDRWGEAVPLAGRGDGREVAFSSQQSAVSQSNMPELCRSRVKVDSTLFG